MFTLPTANARGECGKRGTEKRPLPCSLRNETQEITGTDSKETTHREEGVLLIVEGLGFRV